MGDATASLNAALLGLDGFVVVSTAEIGGELELLIETTADLVGCPACGAVARAKDRRPSWVRDLPIGGRGGGVWWWERGWGCPHRACGGRTGTERPPAIAPPGSVHERGRERAVEQRTVEGR